MNIIQNESSQLISIALIRPIGGTLVGVFKNKTTNDIVKITIEDVEEHTTFAKVTIDASVLYGGEWSYRFFYSDEDGYEVLVSQNIAYVNQVARYEVATAERTYSTRESVRGVCPPCPPCPNAYYINVVADFTMASVAGSCDKAQEDALLFIGCQPREGFRFVRWADDASDNTFNPRFVIVKEDRTYTAICEAVPPTPTPTTHTISITADEHATAIGGGVYEEGKVVQIAMIADTGYKFTSWSDGNIENPRSVVVDADKNYTAVIERVESGGNKFVTIDRNDAVEIFCPQTEGTVGSVLLWRAKKTKPFTIVDFDASYNQQYYGGSVDGYVIWSLNNYQDSNPWQGLIMLSDDDDRNTIKYNVREYPGADFGNAFTPSVSTTTFTSIVGQESASYSNVTYNQFNYFDGVIDYNEITNKFFEPIIDGGQRWGQGVNYTWLANSQASNSCFGTNWNGINFANYSNGQCMTQKYGDCYIKRQGDELIVEYRNGDGTDIAQWHIGITSDYVYVVFSNWVSQLNNVWFNDGIGLGHFKYVDTNMQIVDCKDEYDNDFYPWDRPDLTCQLTNTPTDGMVIRMDVVPNEPKRLDIEVAYSQKVTFYENFNNVCQPYSNNSEDFTVGDKYIYETTGVNFYEFVGYRLPMVSQNAYQLSKYEVKSVMPDIIMLQGNFMNGARLGDYSWMFDKLPNIQTIEGNVLNSTDIRSFEPSVGQWSNLIEIFSYFLYYSMVERVDFTNLTNLTTLRSHLCYGCSNLTYANISKLKDLTEYDNSAWFAQCPNLRDIVFDGTTDQYRDILDTLVWFDNKSNCTLHVAPEHLQTYIDMYGGEWGSIVAIQ